MIEDVFDMLIRHEGLRLKPYRCTSGKLTIGVGRNLDDNGISKAEAIMMLRNDVDDCIKDLEKIFGSQRWESFGDERRKAMVSMRFNLGYARFRQFGKMVAAIKAGDWEEASDQALDSKWAQQIGARAREIADMIRKGGE